MNDRRWEEPVLPREEAGIVVKAARCDKNVLILGETGTGKDVTARMVHELSGRRVHPFVAVNCASLPDDLVEAELFGYTRGSFTGAVRDKEGLLEAAGNGTVFLDEIGELPLRLQAKILRMIDKRETRRIGETAVRTVAARFIFATNRDLEEEVRTGKFRRDLYFRINVVRIRLPSLRERREDIPCLVHQILERENERGCKRKDLSPEALGRLMTYDFPGNIRELENIIERAYVLCEEEIIRDEDLIFEEYPWTPEKDGPLTPDTLRRILASCRWNKTKAAGEIGRSRRQLYRLLEKYRMDDCIRRIFFP